MKDFFYNSHDLDRMVLKPLEHINPNWELTWDEEKEEYKPEDGSFAEKLNKLIQDIEIADSPQQYHDNEDKLANNVLESLNWEIEKILQSDGYSAYNAFEGTKDVCLIACLAHIRRHMELALDENKSLAEYALKQIQELYHIEQIADTQKLNADERCELRQRLAAPILDSFEKWMEQTYGKVSPRSRMGQAITYTYPLWPRMKNYLKDGKLKIDNNLAENALRPLTLSRKNFLFCGNHEAAENTAIICSLLATCKAQEVNPREWLNDVITRLPSYLEKGSGRNVRELLPDVWKLEKSNTNPIGV